MIVNKGRKSELHSPENQKSLNNKRFWPVLVIIADIPRLALSMLPESC